MLILLFFGAGIFGISYNLVNCPDYVTSNSTYFSGQPTNKVIHYSFLFYTFMMMNLFNMLNARRIGIRDFNIFSRLFNNFLFIIIVVLEFVATYFMVTLGGKITTTTSLTFGTWIASVCFGIGSLIV